MRIEHDWAGHRPAAAALLEVVRDHDGRAPDGLPDAATPVVIALVDGTLAGLAWREGGDPAELYVHPDHRHRGIGRALAGQIGTDGGIWAHGTFPAARALAESLGAHPTRRLLQLRRPLDAAAPLPVSPPSGVTIRTFRPGTADETSFLAVNARAFAWHPEQGRLDTAGLHAQMAQPWFDPHGFFLAVTTDSATDSATDDDTVLGFHWTKVHEQERLGEVYVIAVDPDSPIRGLGTPLLNAGLNHLAARGLGTVILYVEADNTAATGLYDRAGFTTHQTDTVFATGRADRTG